jgi:acetyltransferase
MTFTIQRYPMHMIDVLEVANGCRATVRPALPQDAEKLHAFFRALSDEARYFRFMTKLRELPEALAERFAGVDYSSHMALLAEHFTSDRGTIVGEARYIANEGDPSTCEFAIAVADDWQGLGLARTLLERLVRHATASGIRLMAADAISANEAMIKLARRIGFFVEPNPKDGRLWRLTKDLPAADHARSNSGRSLARRALVA